MDKQLTNEEILSLADAGADDGFFLLEDIILGDDLFDDGVYEGLPSVDDGVHTDNEGLVGALSFCDEFAAFQG